MTRSVCSSETQAGFTIAELIIVIVLSALLLPILAVSIQSLKTINRQASIVAALNTAVEAKVESLRATSFDKVALGTTDFSTELPDSIPTPHAATYTVTTSADNPSLKYIDITTSVGAPTTARTFSYRTYMSKDG